MGEVERHLVLAYLEGVSILPELCRPHITFTFGETARRSPKILSTVLSSVPTQRDTLRGELLTVTLCSQEETPSVLSCNTVPQIRRGQLNVPMELEQYRCCAFRSVASLRNSALRTAKATPLPPGLSPSKGEAKSLNALGTLKLRCHFHQQGKNGWCAKVRSGLSTVRCW